MKQLSELCIFRIFGPVRPKGEREKQRRSSARARISGQSYLNRRQRRGRCDARVRALIRDHCAVRSCRQSNPDESRISYAIARNFAANVHDMGGEEIARGTKERARRRAGGKKVVLRRTRRKRMKQHDRRDNQRRFPALCARGFANLTFKFRTSASNTICLSFSLFARTDPTTV